VGGEATEGLTEEKKSGSKGCLGTSTGKLEKGCSGQNVGLLEEAGVTSFK